jgi:hypothetical protein
MAEPEQASVVIHGLRPVHRRCKREWAEASSGSFAMSPGQPGGWATSRMREGMAQCGVSATRELACGQHDLQNVRARSPLVTGRSGLEQ